MQKRIPTKCRICGQSCTIRKGKFKGHGRHVCSYRCAALFGAIARRATPERKHLQINSAGLINTRVRRGAMNKPDRCEKCGKKARLDGHHDDYARPDAVRWLCRSCHMKWHSENTWHQSPQALPA